MQIVMLMALLGALNVSLDFDGVSPTLVSKGDSVGIFSEGMPIPAEGGVPMLPVDGITVALSPGQRAVELKVKEARYSTVASGIKVAPVPAPEPTVPPEIMQITPKAVSPREDIYSSDRFYPVSPVELVSSGHLLGWPVAAVKVNPFRYNPVSGKVEKLEHLEFELVTESDPTWNPRPFSRLTARYAERFIKSVVVNPEIVHLTVSDDVPMEYLILVPEAFREYADSIAVLQRMIGFKADVRTMEWISSHYAGRDNAEKLRNYLKTAVDSGLMFVAIAGDEGYMPVRVAYAMTAAHGAYHEDSIRADLYFSDLDGTWDADNDGTFGEVEDLVDMYPDVFVGRIPAATSYGLSLYYRKMKRYLFPDSVRYLHRVVLNGMILWNEPFSPGGVAKEFVDSVALPDSIDVVKLYEYRGTSSYDTAVAEMRRGSAIYNHNGHGWYYAMWVANHQRIHRNELDHLGNPHNYGFLYTTGCWVGAFDYYSFGEVYTILENTPGIGFIGNSRYGWGSPGNPGFGYSDIFDTEFFKKLFKDSISTVSMTLAASKIRFIPLSQWKNVYRWHEYEINVLADPTLEIHRGEPAYARISMPRQVVPGETLVVSVRYPNGRPVDGAVVVVTAGDSLLVRGLTDGGGSAALPLPDTLLSDSVTVAVRGEAIVGMRTSLPVLAHYDGPFMVVRGVTAFSEGGLVAEPGREFTLHIKLRNIGSRTAHSVETVLSLDSMATLYHDRMSFRDVAAGEYVMAVFHGKLSADIPDGYGIGGDLLVIVDGDTVSYGIGFAVGLPQLRPLRHAVFAEGDSIIECGERVGLSILLTNEGHSPVRRGRFELVPVDRDFVRLIEPVNDSVDVEPGDTVELLFHFVVGNVDGAAGVNFKLMMTDGLGHRWEYPFMLMVGNIGTVESFENSAEGWRFGGHWTITPSDAHEGARSAFCGIEGIGYLPGWDDTLMSPYLALPPDPVLSFWLKFETANYGVDGVFVYVQQDTATYMLDFIGSGGALDSSLVIHLGWSQYSYDLSFLDADKPVRVFFVFRSDSDDLVGSGFHIDDVMIGGSIVDSGASPLRVLTASPNPASGWTRIRFDLRRNGTVDIEAYDISGRRIRMFHLGMLDEGPHVRSLNLREFQPGVYFLRVMLNGRSVGMVRLVVLGG